MLRRLRTFLKSDQGAVTVDWVLLTGALVLLVIAVFPSIFKNTTGLAQTVAATVSSGPAKP